MKKYERVMIERMRELEGVCLDKEIEGYRWRLKVEKLEDENRELRGRYERVVN